jgi:hypothetical protein
LGPERFQWIYWAFAMSDFFCHSEQSEESMQPSTGDLRTGFFALLLMNSPPVCHPERSEGSIVKAPAVRG